MKSKIKKERLYSFWKSNNAKLVLIILLAIFIGYSTFLASNLKLNIIPDEAFHFSMSQSFAKTIGVPYETPASLERGIFIRQNPYFAYWIYGRTLNIFSLVKPNVTNWQQLVFLRLINVIFSLGTVLFTYLFSRELFKNKWWPLLPVFLLTNTLMYVVLSSGVSYDNPANFLSILSLFFLLRILNNKAFISNSLGMLISLCLGALIKFTIVPLTAALLVVWITYIALKHPVVATTQLKLGKNILFLIIVAILFGFTFSIYGVNLIEFHSLTPTCPDYYSEEFCKNAPFLKGYYELRLPEKLTITSAIKQGYPEPVRYVFDTWIRAMLLKIVGVMGNLKSYFPMDAAYFQMLFYWTTLLLFRYFKKSSFKIYSFIGIILFYSLVLLIKNYNTELIYGFIQVAHQGRYIFPVITVIYCLLSYGLMKVPNKILKFATLAVTIVLFIYGGPLKFITHYRPVFASWFIN